MKKITLSLLGVLSTFALSAQWTTIITDASGDSGDIDATALEYQYDANTEEVLFRVTLTNLSSYSSGPAADFSFNLPSGLESGAQSGTHWSSTTAVHKTAYVYCDPGGTAPSSYTYNTWSQRIEETSTTNLICSNCIDIDVDVPANQITYTFDRQDIISDAEVGGATSVDIGLVMNVGHDVAWNDAVTHAVNGGSSASFTLNFPSTASLAEADFGNAISIFPNPCEETIAIQSNLDGTYDVAIFDYTGKNVLQTSSQMGQAIQVSHLESGSYIVVISQNSNVVAYKRLQKK